MQIKRFHRWAFVWTKHYGFFSRLCRAELCIQNRHDLKERQHLPEAFSLFIFFPMNPKWWKNTPRFKFLVFEDTHKKMVIVLRFCWTKNRRIQTLFLNRVRHFSDVLLEKTKTLKLNHVRYHFLCNTLFSHVKIVTVFFKCDCFSFFFSIV